ncbi:MAG TPA: hypothetical protein VGN04_05795 [Herbaspirillum sp.]|jgi:hypothetical protein
MSKNHGGRISMDLDIGEVREGNAAAVAKIYANLKIPAGRACKCRQMQNAARCLAANGRRSDRYFR